MASRRALDLASRGQSFASHLLRKTVSWLKFTKPEKSIPNTHVIYISAFERAMQDVYGSRWQKRLNSVQWEYVRKKWAKRLTIQATMIGGPSMRHARDDEYHPAWHKKVERFRSNILQEKQAREEKRGLPRGRTYRTLSLES